MHRLFVAIRPPRPMREALLAIMGGVANARWQNDDQLHLTLRFIGEVDRHQAEDVAAALGAVHHPRFSLAAAGLGHFDRRGRIDALWTGVTPTEEVTALHNKIDQALVRVGVSPDTRAFLPHVTLARLRKAAGPIEPFVAGAAGFATAPCEIGEFCLYESALGRDGSVYTIVARYPLR